MDYQKFETQIKKWILEYVILGIISKKDSYSSDMLAILKKNDLIIVEWTLYPLLSRLKNEWYVSYYWMESLSWPPRKYFKITESGKELFRALNKIWLSTQKSINDIINFIS
jgi:PadR family transcriptional regulator, regulatory protein PadR